MTELLACSRCEGLIPASAERCPHCDRRGTWRRLSETAVGSALAMTLMACYGASYAMREPPVGPDDSCRFAADEDRDGYCEQDCNDADPKVNPRAEDVPGDGIDQDCSGEDAVGNVVLEQDGDDPEKTDAPPPDQEMAQPE